MKSPIAGLTSALLLAIALAPTSAAGTMEDPEITDAAGDGDADRNFDLTRSWVESVDPDFINVYFEFTDTPSADFPQLNALHMRTVLWFKPTAGLPEGKTAAVAVLRYNIDPTAASTDPSIDAWFAFATTAGEYPPVFDEVSVQAEFDVKVGRVTIPAELLPGFVVGTHGFTEMYAQIDLVSKGPLRGEAAPGTPYPEPLNEVVETFDRAPDEGFGRDWSAAGAGPAPLVLEAAGPVEVPSGGSSTVNVTVTNGGAAPVAVTFSSADVPEGFTVAFDPETVEVPASGSATTSLTISTDAEAGTEALFQVVATGADGGSASLPLTVAVVEGEAGPKPTITTTATSTTSTGTSGTDETGAPETTDNTDEKSGIPGPEAALLVAALAAAVVVARRRRD